MQRPAKVPEQVLQTTVDKKPSSLVLNFFSPGVTYKLAMLTVSDPNPSNRNTVISNFSAPFSFNMPKTCMDLTLNGAGAATSETSRSTGATQAGYATASVKSGSTPYATALFSYRRNGTTVSETGVPASPPTSSARFFVDYRTDTTLPSFDTKVDIYTGFAAVNPGNGPASVSFTLRDPEGQIISRRSGSLEKDAHLAGCFNQLPDIVPGFSPVADLNQPPPSPILFPQIAEGDGFSTQFILLNPSGPSSTTLCGSA